MAKKKCINARLLRKKMKEAFDCDPPVYHDILSIIKECEK